MPPRIDPVERSSLEILFGALERAGARYLVAGGLAVLAHGYLRLTLDAGTARRLLLESTLRSWRSRIFWR